MTLPRAAALAAMTLGLLAVTALWACDDGGSEAPRELAPSAGLDPDAAPPASGNWPRPGPDVTWQWQLQGEIETGYGVDIYDVDLFEVPDAVIAELHAAGRQVLCYFSAGSAEDWRPDFGDFDPRVIGDPLDGWAGERWLDVRAANVVAVMAARLDLARSRGCDGVEPDNVMGYDESTGFGLTERDQLAFDRWLANAAHTRGLTIALKNAGGLAAELEPYFDLELNEQCHEYGECGDLVPFSAAGKPILNAEYAESEAAATDLAVTLCPKAAAAGTRTLILPLDLDGTFRVACD